MFHNAKLGKPTRVTLEEMGHPKQAIPMNTYNFTADKILNDTTKKKRTNTIDMGFYWVQDIIRYDHHNRFWKPGANNLADYFTKNHPLHHY